MHAKPDELRTTTEVKSKSQRKREMLELQALGEQLVKLKDEQLNKFPLDEKLRAAIISAKTITQGEALRRQLQYIGRLMRHCDPQPIQEVLTTLQHQNDLSKARFKRLEKWREQLIAGNAQTLTEIIKTFPHGDSQHLRQLLRNAQQEMQSGNKTAQAAKVLFRYLRQLQEG